MTNLLEDFTAELNRHVFLREFSFDRNKFKTACGQEYELADHVISMPHGTMIFQLKEREEDAPADAAAINTWFRKKVLGKACGQLADSQRYLREERPLIVRNQRGHAQDLSGQTQVIVSLVLYASPIAPPGHLLAHHHISKRAGFVHILSVQDYYNLCQTLAAPIELFEFFRFRQDLLLRSPKSQWFEAQIAAQFIMDTHEVLADTVVRETLARTRQDNQSLDLSGMLAKFGERIVGDTDGSRPHDYYAVLAELAQLNRSQLRNFKKLFNWAIAAAEGDEFEIPARLHSLSSNIGFVFIPLPRNVFHRRLNALRNFTEAMKYDFRLDRQVGVSVVKDGDMLEIDWMLIEAPWQPDSELEKALSSNYPFRTRPQPQPSFRYQFSVDDEGIHGASLRKGGDE